MQSKSAAAWCLVALGLLGTIEPTEAARPCSQWGCPLERPLDQYGTPHRIETVTRPVVAAPIADPGSVQTTTAAAAICTACECGQVAGTCAGCSCNPVTTRTPLPAGWVCADGTCYPAGTVTTTAGPTVIYRNATSYAGNCASCGTMSYSTRTGRPIVRRSRLLRRGGLFRGGLLRRLFCR